MSKQKLLPIRKLSEADKDYFNLIADLLEKYANYKGVEEVVKILRERINYEPA